MMDSYIITKLLAKVISRKQKMSLADEEFTGCKQMVWHYLIFSAGKKVARGYVEFRPFGIFFSLSE